LRVGSTEAAGALGLNYYRTMRHIVLPQALRVMIPPTIGVYVSTIKESSLASIIGFVELLGQGMAIRESNAGRSTADVLVAVALGYFAICYSLSLLGRHFERRATRDLLLQADTMALGIPPTVAFTASRTSSGRVSGETGR
jgi:polar amino acid transport system permease protein